MALPAALLAHLQDLTASLGQNDQDLEETLAVLTAALRATATSYCGFQLTIVKRQWPVTLTAFSDGHDVPVRTSLRLPLALVSQAFDPESRVVFFAVTPGALTDLATDLSHALGGAPVEQQSPAAYSGDRGRTGVAGQPNAIELDSDLPLVSPPSGLAGLAELTVLNRAIGMLVDQGHDIEQAHQVLRREAAAAQVEPHNYATRILRRRMWPAMINYSTGSKINMSPNPPKYQDAISRREHDHEIAWRLLKNAPTELIPPLVKENRCPPSQSPRAPPATRAWFGGTP